MTKKIKKYSSTKKKYFEKEYFKKDNGLVKVEVLKSFWLSGVFHGAGSVIEVVPEKATLLLSRPQAFKRV